MYRLQTIDPPKIPSPGKIVGSENWDGQIKCDKHEIAILISVIAAGFTIAPQSVLCATRCSADIALSRQAAMYLAHVSLGLSLTEVGRRFERDRTTVAHACRLIEDLRDEAGFDFALDHLESAAHQLSRFCETS